jgi:hypothetical protein
MSDANPLPENPYAAPQVVSAELVPAIDPAALGPDELPCHRCGQGVSQDAATCPRCGARPRYDGLQLIVTAVLAFSVFMCGAFLLQSLFPQLDVGPLGIFIGLFAAIVVVVRVVKPVFKKLRRGMW